MSNQTSKDNVISIKSYEFALNIIKVYIQISIKKKEYTLSKQLLKSGTSIGANGEEALGAQSRKDFISKLSISYKECRETKYWLNLLSDTDFIDHEDYGVLIKKCDELSKILTSILNTLKKTKILNS